MVLRATRRQPASSQLARKWLLTRFSPAVVVALFSLVLVVPSQWAAAKDKEKLVMPKGSASQILKEVFERATKQGCFTAPLVESWKGVERRRAIVTACKNSGSYDLISRTSTLEERIVDGKLYVRGNARALLFFFNAPEREFAGKWIRIPANSKFAKQVQAITLSSALRELQPLGPLRISGVLRVNGKPGFALIGVADRDHPSVAKLFISLQSPQLPVLLQSTSPAVKDFFEVGPLVFGGKSVDKPKTWIDLSELHQVGTGDQLPPR